MTGSTTTRLHIAILCVVLQEATAATQVYPTAIAAVYSLGSTPRWVSMMAVGRIGANSLPPRKLDLLVPWKVWECHCVVKGGHARTLLTGVSLPSAIPPYELLGKVKLVVE